MFWMAGLCGANLMETDGRCSWPTRVVLARESRAGGAVQAKWASGAGGVAEADPARSHEHWRARGTGETGRTRAVQREEEAPTKAGSRGQWQGAREAR
ncbi:hypothetical protein Taro_054772 [Colocasia esculenta]|uniref:Uncharacterized protein n=1 Tax=Colocasia esculenta TaxID=4460 RepID=A0A843XS84_COLES|nr:hypothetical protein [Colocasia esculenta]